MITAFFGKAGASAYEFDFLCTFILKRWKFKNNRTAANVKLELKILKTVSVMKKTNVTM